MKKILIVEDDSTVADILANDFRDAGFEVETQTDGLAAVNRISASKLDAVLLDLDLPKVSGVEVLQRVRAQAHVKELPILVLTNAYQHNAIEQAWKAGATLCLVKASTTPNRVIEAFRKILEPKHGKKSPPPIPIVLPACLPQNTFAKSDTAFLARIKTVFAIKSVIIIGEIEGKWREFQTKSSSALQLAALGEIVKKLNMLTGLAAVAELRQIADFSSALKALICLICEKSDTLTPSTSRTLALGFSYLNWMLKHIEQLPPRAKLHPKVLVVDDDAITRETILAALYLINAKVTVAERPESALSLLEANSYDLALLDVDMPGMTGFELCGRLRNLPTHKNTPVIFVTGMGKFENQVQSKLCGGDDLIGKPFELIELAVKSLMYLLRAQIS